MPTRPHLLASTILLLGLVACGTDVVTQYCDAADPKCVGGTTSTTDPTDPKGDGTTTASSGGTPIVGAVSIDKVSLYQGVEVRLVKGGAEVTKRNAPIITNRPALVRVSATKDASVRVGKVTAKLHLKVDGEETVLTDGPKSLITFDDTSLDSTFNFELTAEQMTSDVEMSVELVGTDAKDAMTFFEDDAALKLEAKDAAKLRVELIPVKYEADGSNRLPNLDAASVKRYHDALYQMYPVSEVEVTQHAQLDWEVPIDPTGTGWDQLLNAVMGMRQDEEVDEDVYYIGVFNPAASIREYCGHGGCVLGIAPAAGFGNPAALDTQMALRSALIVGYQTDHSGGTISQELAHAMGRLHAPCGNPAAIDKNYPYKEAQIGSSGWDVLSKDLVSSDDHADFMSYCSPVWVSDYTWSAIFNRMTKVQESIAKTTKDVATTTPKEISKQAYRLPALSKTRDAYVPLRKDQIAWTMQQP